MTTVNRYTLAVVPASQKVYPMAMATNTNTDTMTIEELEALVERRKAQRDRVNELERENMRLRQHVDQLRDLTAKQNDRIGRLESRTVPHETSQPVTIEPKAAVNKGAHYGWHRGMMTNADGLIDHTIGKRLKYKGHLLTCKRCGEDFIACRKDAVTCSDECRNNLEKRKRREAKAKQDPGKQAELDLQLLEYRKSNISRLLRMLEGKGFGTVATSIRNGAVIDQFAGKGFKIWPREEWAERIIQDNWGLIQEVARKVVNNGQAPCHILSNLPTRPNGATRLLLEEAKANGHAEA